MSRASADAAPAFGKVLAEAKNIDFESEFHALRFKPKPPIEPHLARPSSIG
jgi:hypothetical protein